MINRVKYSPLRRLMMIAAIANQAKKKKQKEKADRKPDQQEQ
jgi:hypothetical protein